MKERAESSDCPPLYLIPPEMLYLESGTAGLKYMIQAAQRLIKKHEKVTTAIGLAYECVKEQIRICNKKQTRNRRMLNPYMYVATIFKEGIKQGYRPRNWECGVNQEGFKEDRLSHAIQHYLIAMDAKKRNEHAYAEYEFAKTLCNLVMVYTLVVRERNGA